MGTFRRRSAPLSASPAGRGRVWRPPEAEGAADDAPLDSARCRRPATPSDALATPSLLDAATPDATPPPPVVPSLPHAFRPRLFLWLPSIRLRLLWAWPMTGVTGGLVRVPYVGADRESCRDKYGVTPEQVGGGELISVSLRVVEP